MTIRHAVSKNGSGAKTKVLAQSPHVTSHLMDETGISDVTDAIALTEQLPGEVSQPGKDS